jgi:hypothetical protein
MSHLFHELVEYGDASSLDEILLMDPRLLFLIDLESFKALIFCLCKFRKDVEGRSYICPECDIVMSLSIRKPIYIWAIFLSDGDEYLRILSNLSEIELYNSDNMPENALVHACRNRKTKAVCYLIEEDTCIYGGIMIYIADLDGFEELSLIFGLVRYFQHNATKGYLTEIINSVAEGKNIAPFKQWFDWLSDQNRGILEKWINHQVNNERNTYDLLFSSKYEPKKSQMRRFKNIDTIRIRLLSFLVYPKAKTRHSIRYINDHIKRYRAWHLFRD